jgi:AcrR family transcriptional regulator
MTMPRKESNTTTKGHERAGAILSVAREILGTEGYGALSMRSVAARVGVSLSTVQHYYPSREVLLEALLNQAFDGYQAGIDQRLAQRTGTDGGSGKAVFQSIIDYFLDDLRDQISSGLFFEIAALANRHPYASRMFDTMLTRARRTLRNLMRDIAPELTQSQCEIRGALIVSQMIGLMIFLSDTRPKHGELAELQQEATAAIMRTAFS